MSRGAQGQAITVKPALNVYTVLAVVGFLAVALALVIVYYKAQDLFGPGGLTG